MRPFLCSIPARVPGEVEVEQVGAVRLEVQTFPGGICRQQNAKRVLGRIGVEALLDFPPPCRADQPVNHLDALVRQVRSRDRFLQDGLQIALGPLPVLGEDQHPAVVPGGPITLSQFAEGRQPGAEVFPYPVDKPPHLRVRQVPGLLGDLLHAVQEFLLPAPELLCPWVSNCSCLGPRPSSPRPRRFPRLRADRLSHSAALVVGVRRRPQQAVLLFRLGGPASASCSRPTA